MKKHTAAYPAPRPAASAPGRRTVVLLSELVVEGRARPLPVGAVVEAEAERFAHLHEDHVRDATEQDVAIAGHLFLQLDLAEPESASTDQP